MNESFSQIYVVDDDVSVREAVGRLIRSAGFSGRSDHVTFYFNSGHPGVAMPHYHFVIWHVSREGEASVAK